MQPYSRPRLNLNAPCLDQSDFLDASGCSSGFADSSAFSLGCSGTHLLALSMQKAEPRAAMLYVICSPSISKQLTAHAGATFQSTQ